MKPIEIRKTENTVNAANINRIILKTMHIMTTYNHNKYKTKPSQTLNYLLHLYCIIIYSDLSPNLVSICWDFWLFWKSSFCKVKSAVVTFGAIMGKNWTNFYVDIWSHCPVHWLRGCRKTSCDGIAKRNLLLLQF